MSTLTAVFRCDASLQMGSGHVMRDLTLADELRRNGAEISFVCREHPGNLIDFIRGKGYAVATLAKPADDYVCSPGDCAHAAWLGVPWSRDAADTIRAVEASRSQWLVVDHYALDARWEKALRAVTAGIMVIDDLADRRHDCELLLDQNLYPNAESRYHHLLPAQARKLLGPQYALLRPQFREAARTLAERDGGIRHIVVFFGGSDLHNATGKALQALKLTNRPEIAVTVVLGGTMSTDQRLTLLASEMSNVVLRRTVENMAGLMAQADLFIGAGGSTTWERCFLGVPSITVITAENQKVTTEAVAAAGGTLCLGDAREVSPAELAGAISALMQDPTRVKVMGARAAGIMSGPSLSGAEAVVQAILGASHAA